MSEPRNDTPGALPFPNTPEIIFASWREQLHRSGLSAGIQTICAMAVRGYLDYCRHNGLGLWGH